MERESPICVGRDAELGRLRSALHAAAGGQGRLGLLSGDAGIGKTRLAEALAADAATVGATVLWGRCWEAGGAPAYWPWIEALRALVAERGARVLRDAAPAAAAEAARLAPELAEGPAAEPPADPDAARFALFDGVAELLLAAARERPLLLVLEDLHAGDTASLLLLDLLAPRLAAAPALVLGTHRRTDPATHAAVEAQLARLERRGEALTLAGLDADATRALARASAGADLSDSAVTELQRRTDGNPFFVQSLAHLIGQSDDPASPLALPAGVRDAVGRRLAPLPEGTRAALAGASVLGRAFTAARLARLRGIEPAEALGLVDPAARAGLVLAGDAPGELRFAHALIRDWLYGELEPSERAELHRREGDALETEAAHRPELLRELAHHRLAAAPMGGTEAALEACERAADHALRAFAFEDAAALLDRAVALLDRSLHPLEPARHAGLLLALGEARQRAGDTAAAREAFVRAANFARASELPEELARAALGFGGVVINPGETDETLVALLEQALALVPASQTVLRSRLLARLARELHFSADTARPRKLAEEAVALARGTDDAAAQAFALEAWHVAHAVPDTARERLEVSDQIVERARAGGEPELELSGWVLGAIDLLELARPDTAAEKLDVAERLAMRLRQPALTWRVLLVRATLALLAGRFGEAERVIADAHAIGRRSRGPAAFRYSLLQRRELHYLRGGDEDLEPEFRLLADHPTEVWGGSLVHLQATTGKLEQARAGFEVIAAAGFGGPVDDMAALPMLSRYAEICTVLEDRERAAILYERLLPYADCWLVFAGGLCTGAVRVRLGALAATLGDHQRAAEHLEAAVAAHRAAGAAPIAALAEAELADALRRLGQDERADELLGHALRTAEALDMRPLIERIGAGQAEAPEAPAVEARLELDGELWSADFAGSEVKLRDRKGIGYLARLLERPHLEVSALELAGDGTVPPQGDAGALLDEEAKRAYRRRVDELREEIDEAERWNDPERAERAAAELDLLTAELSRAVGLGGRDRRAASNAERARVSVTRAIRSAMGAIEEHHAALGAHLGASVRTGAYCRYAPAAGEEVVWRVRR